LSIGLLAGCASRGAWVGCQAADTATTLYTMERGGRELNPVVDAIFTAAGPAGFIAAKAGVTLFVLHEFAEIPSGLMAVASGVTCLAALNNLNVARRLAAEEKVPP